jgi:hypothetical protein
MTINDDDEFGSLTMNHTNKPAVKPIKKLAPPPSTGPSRPGLAAPQQPTNLLDVSTAASPAPAPAAGTWDDLLAPVPPAPAQAAPTPSWDTMLAPSSAVSPPAPNAAPPGAAGPADIDALFDSIHPAPATATQAAQPAAGSNVNTTVMTDSDFDAFLSGLKS